MASLSRVTSAPSPPPPPRARRPRPAVQQAGLAVPSGLNTSSWEGARSGKHRAQLTDRSPPVRACAQVPVRNVSRPLAGDAKEHRGVGRRICVIIFLISHELLIDRIYRCRFYGLSLISVVSRSGTAVSTSQTRRE